jgi:sigma-B regulation protein RsbU (phosphoserine phosphatase)
MQDIRSLRAAVRHHTIPPPRAPAVRDVLLVDDSRAQRRLLALTLARAGYAVTEAGSGEEALALCRDRQFDFVLSDWMTPGMSGPEFCRAFRALPRAGYGYFILLTSKSGKAHVADGLDCGADDFLSKPVNPEELRARLRAGDRIIRMQEQLVEKNRLIGATLEELQKVYDSLDSDLIEARKLQQTLVRDRQRSFDGGQATLLLRPSGRVGGDLVGFFLVNPRRLALFAVDVAGHGIASAIMTARLAGLMTGASPQQNIAVSLGAHGPSDAWPPEMVAYRLNRLMLEELQVEQYFTMAYAEVDLNTGRLRLVQAGHPHPVILRRGGGVDVIGDGGLPIGLVEEARFERVEATLQPGDRLFLMSDGVTECPAPDGAEFGEQGLRDFLASHAGLDDSPLLESLVWRLTDHMDGTDFPDDVSGVLFRFTGSDG